MRRLAVILTGLFVAAAVSAQGAAPAVTPAKSADEIIAGYVKTIGGSDKLEAIKTLRRSGRYTFGSGLEAKYSEDNKRPDLVRQELVLQGMVGVTAYDGKSGWKIEPWEGKKDVEPLGEEEMEQIIEDA